MLRYTLLALSLTAALATPARAAPAYADVASIFNSRCVICHNGPAAPNGLQLGSYEAIMAGSKNGPAVVAGAPAGSELVKRIRGERQPRMPLTGPPWLSDAEVALIEGWIQAGAPKGNAPAPAAAAAVAPAAISGPVNYGHVEPILLSRCVKCHVETGGKMGPPPEGYVLRSYAQTIAATDRARVIPGNPAASELLRRVKGLAQPRMPFDGPPWLGDDEIKLLERWIADGARDRDGKPAPVPVGARVRLRGTLTAPGEIDGARFDARGARIDKSPRVGGAAELRATVQPDGSLLAERLRGR
ncbi:Cytochrome c [Rubrivivax sp. A210]|uniref:c-type cytochrome domain-containing protein n=1 Tax=Rubrivivax sp. A210 TaxID=2772301 RepID=UPI0019AEC217|nr:c-type cytochrome domain-containing protein [Rubrivivax sp. A210]CAD5369822.1 Cytochrome c [Rubrivivax sp. A210]